MFLNKNFIKTPLSYIGWFTTCLSFTLLCIPVAYLPENITYKNNIYFSLTSIWSQFLLFFSFIHIKTKGEEHISKTPTIFVANHSSTLDVFFLEALLGTKPHIWLCKNSYTRIPLFSLLLKKMHIPVNRESSTDTARALLTAYKKAKQTKKHIIIFPEGKRFSDGQIHPFNNGFALLAKKLGYPVIPIKLTGLHKIFPKHKIIIDYNATKPTAFIGKPITINNQETPQEFSTRVYDWFKSH